MSRLGNVVLFVSVVGLFQATAGETYLGALERCMPKAPVPETRAYDAVAAAYSFRTPDGAVRFTNDVAFTAAVYGGRDYVTDTPEGTVVLSCPADVPAAVRGERIQELIRTLEPGDIVTTTDTNGVHHAVLYAGNVYGDGQFKALAVNAGGIVCERGCGYLLFNWPLTNPLKIRCPIAFRVIRPLLDPAVRLAEGRAFPKGIGIETDDERLRAILAMAWARYLKRELIQYDSCNVVGPSVWKKHSARWGRLDYRGKVEQATADRTRYTVCSSFVYESLWELFGYGLGDDHKGHLSFDLTGNPPPDIFVYAYDKKANAKPAGEVIGEVRRILEPGDVIAYSSTFKKGPGGHVVLYVGEVDGMPTILHSTGQKYDFDGRYDKTEFEGTMVKDDLEAIFLTPGEPRYLLKFDRFVVLRPLKHAGLKLTPVGVARAKHPKFRYDRRVQVGCHGSVVSGEKLTYTAELFNADGKPCDAAVTETVPEGTAFVSASDGCVVDGRKLSWPIELKPGARRTVSWTVKVTAKPGARIVSAGGSAGGIPSNRLVTDVVGRKVSVTDAFAWADRNLAEGAPLPSCRVRGWGGGYESPEPSRGIRIMEARSRDLMPGDVVVSVPKGGGARRIWVKGKKSLRERLPDGSLASVPESEVTALLACDFFAAFRPAAEPVEVSAVARMDSRVDDPTRGPGIFGDYWWANRFLDRQKQIGTLKGQTVDLVMIGDSITHFWEWKHPESWKAFTSGRSVLNLGYGGDRVENVIWRIEHGELDGYTAKTVALMIGTNNNHFPTTDPANVAAGIRTAVAAIRKRQPTARIILQAILPRGNSSTSKSHAGARARNDRTNKLLAAFAAENPDIVFVDCGAKFLNADGWVPAELMADEIHPTDAGYALWREALEPFLAEGWEPSVKKGLDALVARNRGNPDAYAVFDFDYTIALGDLTYTCLWRILEMLDFRFGDFKACFAPGVPEDEQGEIAALGAIVEDLKAARPGKLTDDPRWKDFTFRYWKLYRRLYKRFGDAYGCEWRSRMFKGYEPQELAALARRAIPGEMARPGLRPDATVPSEKRGFVIAKEMRELIANLRAAGIDVYIVSGSDVSILRVAAGKAFGLDFPEDHVFGRNSGVIAGRKPDFIRERIASRHHGAEPVLVGGDSMGDYAMFTEFGNLQAGLLFHRNWREREMWELAESAANKGRILVQGRDEFRGVYIPSTRSIFAKARKR